MAHPLLHIYVFFYPAEPLRYYIVYAIRSVRALLVARYGASLCVYVLLSISQLLWYYVLINDSVSLSDIVY